MTVHLIWSKQQSKNLASLLYIWLPQVIPDIKPWMSDKDIAKGTEWFRELQEALKHSSTCIICLTSENIRSPWIYYETGAIATNIKDVSIYPYLLKNSQHILNDGPLAQWQFTIATESDTWNLIKTLNEKASSSSRKLAPLEKTFQAQWPNFKKQLDQILDTESIYHEDFIATDVDQLAGINLLSEARRMIPEISKDPHGQLIQIAIIGGGVKIQTNGSILFEGQNPKTEAKWAQTLKDLLTHNIIDRKNPSIPIYSLTAKGFEIAKALENKN